MNLLDRVEQAIEYLMEGSIGRLFRSSVQPAEIGRKLERAMMANQAASVDGPIAPNDYQVTIHPEDLASVADYVTALTRQLETWIMDTARERGLSLIDRVRVQLIADKSVPRRAIRVTAAIADRPLVGREEQDAVQRTEVYRVIRETSGATPIRLQVLNGPHREQEFIIRQPVTTVGRALDNNIVIDSSEVSRHHARIERTNDGLLVVDLKSTNGTRVNGRLVQSHPITAGDEVMLGSMRFAVLPFEPGLRKPLEQW